MGKVISRKQSDWRWGKKTIGNSGLTIAAKGCLITIISDVLYWYGYPNYTPDVLAKLFDFLTNGNLIWKSIEKAPLKFVYRYWQYNDDTKKAIQEAFNHPTKCILLEVIHPKAGKHWVWVTGIVPKPYNIADPLYGDFSNTLRYGEKITGAAIIDLKK